MGGGGVIVLVVAMGYLIWYMLALGCLICQKIKSSPVGGGGVEVVCVDGVLVVVAVLTYSFQMKMNNSASEN